MPGPEPFTDPEIVGVLAGMLLHAVGGADPGHRGE
jgi:hypothetical protein